jgi:hypothetical protein
MPHVFHAFYRIQPHQAERAFLAMADFVMENTVASSVQVVGSSKL